MLEFGELGLPIWAEFGGHAPFDERPAHRRGIALQFAELGDIFGRQQVGHCRHQLGDLHDRAFEAAKGASKLGGTAAAVALDAEDAARRDARGNAADIGADARVTRCAGGKAIGFGIAGVAVRQSGPHRAGTAPHLPRSMRDGTDLKGISANHQRHKAGTSMRKRPRSRGENNRAAMTRARRHAISP